MRFKQSVQKPIKVENLALEIVLSDDPFKQNPAKTFFDNFIQFFVKQGFLVLGTSFARIRNKNVAATLNKSHDPLKMLSVKAT